MVQTYPMIPCTPTPNAAAISADSVDYQKNMSQVACDVRDILFMG